MLPYHFIFCNCFATIVRFWRVLRVKHNKKKHLQTSKNQALEQKYLIINTLQFSAVNDKRYCHAIKNFDFFKYDAKILTFSRFFHLHNANFSKFIADYRGKLHFIHQFSVPLPSNQSIK
jgi:hypothetical protein